MVVEPVNPLNGNQRNQEYELIWTHWRKFNVGYGYLYDTLNVVKGSRSNLSTFLVTGNAGFIGSAMVDFLIERGHDVYGIDALYEGSCRNNVNAGIKNWWTFPLHGIYSREWKAIYHLPDIDYILHIAAFSNVDTSIRQPQLFNMNYAATSNILEYARMHDIPVIQISTDEVFGSWVDYDGYEKGFQEYHPLNPSNPYAASKAACDLLCLSYQNTYKDMDIRITRCSNNYGIRQQDKLIPTIMKKVLNNEKIPIFSTPATRDWLHVEDHCEAIMTVLEKGGPGEIYNITANDERSPQEIVELLGYSDRIELVNSRLAMIYATLLTLIRLKTLGGNLRKSLRMNSPR